MNTCKRIDGVLMSHHFTVKGKEEYAETIRKVRQIARKSRKNPRPKPCLLAYRCCGTNTPRCRSCVWVRGLECKRGAMQAGQAPPNTVAPAIEGNVKKGGELNKDYHYGVEWSTKDGPAPILPMLSKLVNKEIVATYGESKKSRKSLDRGETKAEAKGEARLVWPSAQYPQPNH